MIDADAPVAERDQVVDGFLRAGDVCGGDRRDPGGQLLARVDDDEGVALLVQREQFVRRLGRHDQHASVARVVHEQLDECALADVLVVRGAEDEP